MRLPLCVSFCSVFPRHAATGVRAGSGADRDRSTDSTGGVLPGVTVTAVHEATGNRFVAVTDERGIYRIPARVGALPDHRGAAGLHDGDAHRPAAAGRADGRRQPADGAVDGAGDGDRHRGSAAAQRRRRRAWAATSIREQVQELPVQGRNWMALAMLAPGSRMTIGRPQRRRCRTGTAASSASSSSTSTASRWRRSWASAAQPRYSQESIAEFQFISNRFDATLGRSSGVQVRAITRSGTNTLSGSVRGNFRDSRFNAENPVLNRVVPIDNQQLAFTLGGPILRDRLHFFGHFEYEREPRTSIWNTPYPALQRRAGGQRDDQDGRRPRSTTSCRRSMRLMGKVVRGTALAAVRRRQQQPSGRDRLARRHQPRVPRAAHAGAEQPRRQRGQGRLRPAGSSSNANLTTWSNHWQARQSASTTGSPRITFTGFTIGGNHVLPAARRAGHLERPRRLHVLLRARAAATTCKAGRRVPAVSSTTATTARRAWASSTRATGPSPAQHRGALPGCVQRRHLEPGGDLAARADLRHRRRRLHDRTTCGRSSARGCRTTGRSRSSLTLNLGLRYDLSVNASGNEYAVPPFVEAGTPERHQQHPAARRASPTS